MSEAAPSVEIRHATPADVDGIVGVFSGPSVVRGTLQLPYPSPEMWRARFASPERGWIPLVACVRGEVAGLIGLHTHPDLPRLRHAAWLGMAVREDLQGRGFGTALLRAALDLADGWLQLRRVELQVFTDNAPAIGLYRRFGFEIEGTLRQAAFREGRYDDVHLMARLRSHPDP